MERVFDIIPEYRNALKRSLNRFAAGNFTQVREDRLGLTVSDLYFLSDVLDSLPDRKRGVTPLPVSVERGDHLKTMSPSSTASSSDDLLCTLSANSLTNCWWVPQIYRSELTDMGEVP